MTFYRENFGNQPFLVMREPLDIQIYKAIPQGGKGQYDLMINGEQFSVLMKKNFEINSDKSLRQKQLQESPYAGMDSWSYMTNMVGSPAAAAPTKRLM